MAYLKSLIALAFSGSIGLLFLFLACALPQYDNWYPFTVIIFYLLSPIPSLIAKRYTDVSGESGQCRELAWFLTTGIVVSAFALPIVLHRSPSLPLPPPDAKNATVDPGIITGGACGLVLTANLVMFLTIFGFFLAFDNDDVQYSV
eukprot:TRINITY_DN2425_c0_g1_i3.p1 TRINITY_DN2425_c0_g1~~TRINITY_DN2425_c0_g1_i3.p1  ORF type:complete len:146 (+),score=18.49 TRINITY_DN2425_c0_g1_i3:140-577(+)